MQRDTVTVSDGPWRHRALCDGRSHEFVGELNEWETDRAKDVCARCPVKAECRALGDSVEVGFPLQDLQGVWAGEDPQQRALRRSPRTGMLPAPFTNRRKIRWTKDTAPHGTITRFQTGCGCFECSEANRYSLNAFRRRRRQGRKFGPAHNCRTTPKCDDCKKKLAARARAYRVVKKAATQTGVTIKCQWCDVLMLETDRRKQSRKFCSKECCRKHRWHTKEKVKAA